MATLQGLEAAFLNAHNAGDSKAAAVLAAEIRNVRALDTTKLGASYRPRTSIDPEAPTPLEKTGRGMMDIAQGVKQLTLSGDEAKQYTKQVDEEIALYNKGRGPNAGFDGFRLGGAVLAGVPAAATLAAIAPEAAVAGIGGRLALGGIQGLVQGASEYVPEGGSRIKNAGIGTAGGAVGVPIGEIAARVVAKITQAGQRAGTRLTTTPDQIITALESELKQSGVDWNSLGAEVKSGLMQQARRQLSVSGELSPDMLARKLEMEEVLGPGAGPTQAQVTRNPQQWTWERNTQKQQEIGDPLADRYKAQLQRLNQRLSDAVTEKQQAKAQNAYQAGAEAIGAVQQKMKDSGRVVDDLYSVWRETGAGATEVKPQKLADTLGRVMDEWGVENIAPTVRARMESFGLLGGKQTKVLTIDEAEKLRKLIGNNIDPANRPQAGAMTMLKRSLDEAVMDTEAPDIPSLKAARQAAFERFSVKDSAPAVKAAAEGVEPDKFFRKFVLNGDVRDLRGLRATLTTGVTGAKPTAGIDYEAAGGQAWRELQAQTVRHLIEKAQSLGEGSFSGRAFEKALKELGDERLKVLFAPEQLEALKKLSRVANNVTTEPPFAAVNHSNTAPTLMQYAGDAVKKVASLPFIRPFALPFVGAAEIGAQSLKSTQTRAKVAQALTGEPVDATGASDAYSRLVKMMADRMDPLAASGATTATLYGTQQR